MRITDVIILSVTAALLLTGCGDKDKTPSPDDESRPAESTARTEDSGGVKLKDYSPPLLLENAPPADVLSDVADKSFDPAALLTEPETQPFEDYKCTGDFDGLCYIFKTKDTDEYGILSREGEVLLEPDGVTGITAAGTGLLCVRHKKTRTYYRLDSGGIYETDIGTFDKDRINFEPVPAKKDSKSKDEDNTRYILTLDGKQIYDEEWVNSRYIDIKDLDTSANYEAVWLADNGSNEYYLAFSNMYDLTVCRAELGYIEMNIGGVFGKFYLTDPEDSIDLKKLVGSFNNEPASGAAKGDAGADYITIVFGRDDSEEQEMYTISSDGYCFTEQRSTEHTERFFRKLSRETFADLVLWTDQKFGELKE